jgi:hypothetical protein
MSKYIPELNILLKYCPESEYLKYYKSDYNKINEINKPHKKIEKSIEDIQCDNNIISNLKVFIPESKYYFIELNGLAYLKKRYISKIGYKIYEHSDLIEYLEICTKYNIEKRYSKTNLKKQIYYSKVWIESNKNSKYINNIELRGLDYHLDHIVPISYGFTNNISPLLIGGISNLRIIHKKDNMIKCDKVFDSELYRVNI